MAMLPGTCNNLDFFFMLAGYKEVGKKPKPDALHVECSFDSLPGEEQFCQVPIDNLITGPCTEKNHYGYDKGKPCVLLKLNKVCIHSFCLLPLISSLPSLVHVSHYVIVIF